MQLLFDFWADQQGQDLIEYSLLITFVAIACLALMSTPAPAIRSIWTRSNQQLEDARSVLPGG